MKTPLTDPSVLVEIPAHLRRRTFSKPVARRRFLQTLGLGGLFFTQPGAFAQALTLTPAQTEGPYYPDRLPLDQDNDLLILNDSITPAVGEIAWISGRVLDRSGSPVRGAVVELWQADNQGNYIHSQGINRGTVRDANFQGYGRFETASNGEYLFRTIKPGLYPGRIRHAHFKITLPGGTSLTTQLYIEGETGNDGVLNSVPAAQRSAVVRPWTAIRQSAVAALECRWDIVMNYTPPETPAAARPVLVSFAGVTNAASAKRGLAGSSWVTLFGQSLAPAPRSWTEAGALGESLEGVSVRVSGQAALVGYVSPGQINIVAPAIAQDGPAEITVTTPAGTSDPVAVTATRLQPAFFQYASEYAAAARSDGMLIGPEGLIEGAATTPARPGDRVVLFGTGFGDSPSKERTTLHLDTRRLQADIVELVSPGLVRVEFTAPALEPGDYPLTAAVDGVWTTKLVRLRFGTAGEKIARRLPLQPVPFTRVRPFVAALS